MRKVSTIATLALLLCASLACSRASRVSYKDAVQKALEQADLKDVTVDEDRDRNTITLGGTLHSEQAKNEAGQVVQSVAGGRIIANQISVEPVGHASEARSIESNVDSAIESNYKAALIANGLAEPSLRYSAKNGVLTLKGRVKSKQRRQEAEQVAMTVPNISQVINQIDVKR